MNLETRLGPASLRTWGLIFNFAANAVLLKGAADYVTDGSGLPLLLAGGVVTLGCILLLSTPSRSSR